MREPRFKWFVQRTGKLYCSYKIQRRRLLCGALPNWHAPGGIYLCTEHVSYWLLKHGKEYPCIVLTPYAPVFQR